MIGRLKERFGYRCSGIKINATGDFFVNVPVKKLSFCEALNYSFDVPLLLHRDNISGPGTLRTLGYGHDEAELAAGITKTINSSLAEIRKALPLISRLIVPIENVVLGITEKLEEIVEPDLFIIEMDPWRHLSVNRPLDKTDLNPTRILSICSGFAKCLNENRIVISSGCQGKGDKEKLQKKTLFAAIPADEAANFDPFADRSLFFFRESCKL